VEGAEHPPHDAYVYAIRDEAAFLQVDDEKQPTPPEPLDPASILCQFCGKSWEQVPTLFQAKRRTMDPNTSAIVMVWICNECVAQLGQILAAEPPGTRGLHWWPAWSYRIRR
jgi:ClpX C4-type zinc finger